MGLLSGLSLILRSLLLSLLLSALYTRPLLELLAWALSLITGKDFLSGFGPADDLFRNLLFAGLTAWCASLGRFSAVVVAPVAIANR